MRVNGADANYMLDTGLTDIKGRSQCLPNVTETSFRRAPFSVLTTPLATNHQIGHYPVFSCTRFRRRKSIIIIIIIIILQPMPF
jgi:hypothetical protein